MYKVEKATIRFSLSEPVPVKLIGQIARFRAREAAEREKAKAATPKRPQVLATAPVRLSKELS